MFRWGGGGAKDTYTKLACETNCIIILELSLMFSLLDCIPNGVEPMLGDIENYIVQSGIDDMKACAEIITTVCIDYNL